MALLMQYLNGAVGFSVGYRKTTPARVVGTTRQLLHAESTTATTTMEHVNDKNESPDKNALQAVRAPLKYIGPYPCLALRFPDLATSTQRERNVTGISLDFVLDTAANTNTLQSQVAKELQLDVVGHALPGVSSSGPIFDGGDTYMLGDAELEGLMTSSSSSPSTPGSDDDNKFIFMSNLTASALPVASPAAAGLLSLAFLQAFEGGVEFDWGSSDVSTSTKPPPPSVTFYADKSVDDIILRNKTKVPIQRVPVTELPSVTITVNGVDMPALLDTGSPITVLNAEAAKLAGVDTLLPTKKKQTNPLQVFSGHFEEAQAARRGDILMIAGSDGERTSLIKSKDPAEIQISDVPFGPSTVYIGDLPGLEALKGLVTSPPAVVLGMDVLRKRPRMLLRAQDNEIWFG